MWFLIFVIVNVVLHFIALGINDFDTDVYEDFGYEIRDYSASTKVILKTLALITPLTIVIFYVVRWVFDGVEFKK